MKLIQHHEKCAGARIRARRPADQGLHLRRVEAIVCNLAHAVLLPPPTGRIAVPLGHGLKGRSRYESPFMGKPLSQLLDTLVALSLLDRKWRMIRGEVTSIAPTELLASMIAEFGVQLSDFGRDEGEEVILLSRKKRAGYGSCKREFIDYSDNFSTCADREEVRRLNAFLEQSDIGFIDDGVTPLVDPFDRTMKRHHVIREGQHPRFDQCGRLYGGFWQNLKKDRRRNIRINGEPIAVLDFRSMFPRLAYAAVGAVPPKGDLYAIPGLEGYRSGVKLVMNALLYGDRPRCRLPRGIGVGIGDDWVVHSDPDGIAKQCKARLPKGWTIRRLKEAILTVHPCLEETWERDLGLTLMHQESEILLAILLDLISRNIPILGLHDGLFVPQSQKVVAKEVMERKGQEMTGILLPVSCQLD